LPFSVLKQSIACQFRMVSENIKDGILSMYIGPTFWGKKPRQIKEKEYIFFIRFLLPYEYEKNEFLFVTFFESMPFIDGTEKFPFSHVIPTVGN
jgi:hypothetical protein